MSRWITFLLGGALGGVAGALYQRQAQKNIVDFGNHAMMLNASGFLFPDTYATLPHIPGRPNGKPVVFVADLDGGRWWYFREEAGGIKLTNPIAGQVQEQMPQISLRYGSPPQVEGESYNGGLRGAFIRMLGQPSKEVQEEQAH